MVSGRVVPNFYICQKVAKWPTKRTYRSDLLEDKITLNEQCHIAVMNCANPDLLGRIVHRVGTWKKMCRILAWLLRLGLPFVPLLASDIKRARQLLLQCAQKDLSEELAQCVTTGKGRYRRLAPAYDKEVSLFRDGARMRQHSLSITRCHCSYPRSQNHSSINGAVAQTQL